MTSSDSSAPATPPRPQRLQVGHVPGVTITKWERIWRERFPRTPLSSVEVARRDQRAALDSGQVDLCFVRLPIDADRLHTIRLYDEVPVVVAPKDHPLAAFEEVTLAELAGEPQLPGDLDDAFDQVAWGAGLLRVPHSIARSHSRRDLVYRPVTDAEPTTIAVAWLADNPNELIEEFIGVVRGRTVNSARTAAARAAKEKAAPAATTRPAGRTPRRPTRNTGRGQRRR